MIAFIVIPLTVGFFAAILVHPQARCGNGSNVACSPSSRRSRFWPCWPPSFSFSPFRPTTSPGRYFHVFLIAIPILIQVYFNSALTYGLMHLLKVQHSVAAPGALIGASNFFELAVATAIALFGPGSGAALATVVGVLVEVPVMLSVCSMCNRTRHWFPTEAKAEA